MTTTTSARSTTRRRLSRARLEALRAARRVTGKD